VNSLNDRGIPAELAVVGTIPPSIHLPEHVTAHGFISKHTSAGQVRLKQLLRSAHFLIHPARAEACAVVFSEASAFGVPSVASATGGISSAVRPGRNGFLLPTSAVGADYADVIEEAFADQKAYRRLAASAFETYLNHLNWRVSGAAVAERLGAAVTQWRSSHPGTSGSGRSRMVSLPRLA
jgi:glycosyltransferase involved in cell wall biosynthesis